MYVQHCEIINIFILESIKGKVVYFRLLNRVNFDKKFTNKITLCNFFG